jgi:trimethylamine---corrinoid protein Co-methyltransferase
MNSAQPNLRLRILSDAQINHLLQATLECLQRTGVNVLNAQARNLLASAGATVEGPRVRIPPHLVQDAIAASPRTFTIWGRDPRNRLHVVPGRVQFGPGPTCTNYVDPMTGVRRRARRGDPAMTARVCDALENIDYVMGLALPDDVTPELAPVYEFAEMVANTGKPIIAWAFTQDNIRDIYEIALAAAGGAEAFHRRPFFGFLATCQAPLIHTDSELANTLWAIDHGLPIVYIGGSCSGVSSPITGAGALVVSLAGILSGLAIIQLYRRGAPVVLGSVTSAMDARSARVSYGSPEMSLYSAATADVLEHLNLPFMGTAGISEAKTVDLQAAIESTVQVVFSVLSGASLPHDMGMLDCADIGSLEMLVLCDEIIGMVRRVTRGIEINDTALMLDAIDRIGPGGEFVSSIETARQFRQELWISPLIDRQPWEGWEAAGRPSMLDKIQAKIRTILATHQPIPLPPGAAERIEGILATAEARLSHNAEPVTPAEL